MQGPQQIDAAYISRGLPPVTGSGIEAIGQPMQPKKIPQADDSIGFLVWDAKRLLTQVFSARIARHGLSYGLWPFLRALWAENGLTQRELSERVHMKGPTTVAAINRLERKGLVKRVRSKTDGRKINVYLTDKGRKVLDRVAPEIDFVHRQALAKVPPKDQETFRRILRQFRANLIATSDREKDLPLD
jgi:DNA-binding MarR family transcriptional regulator